MIAWDHDKPWKKYSTAAGGVLHSVGDKGGVLGPPSKAPFQKDFFHEINTTYLWSKNVPEGYIHFAL